MYLKINESLLHADFVFVGDVAIEGYSTALYFIFL